MSRQHLQHAIFILASPDRASFPAEPRLRLFELTRWALLGGDYSKRKNASGIIYAAAEFACFVEDVREGRRSGTIDDEFTALLRATMSRFTFYDLIRANDRTLATPLSGAELSQLRDARCVHDAMLSIYLCRGKVRPNDVYTLQESCLPRTKRSGVGRRLRGKTSLKEMRKRYKSQLAFTSAMAEFTSEFTRSACRGHLRPRALLQLLDEHLGSDRILADLARAKLTLRIIDPALSKDLEACWPSLEPWSLERLSIDRLSAEEQNLFKSTRRKASETKKAKRQRPSKLESRLI